MIPALVAPSGVGVGKIPSSRAQSRALDAARRARRVLQDGPAACQARVIRRSHPPRRRLLLLLLLQLKVIEVIVNLVSR